MVWHLVQQTNVQWPRFLGRFRPFACLLWRHIRLLLLGSPGHWHICRSIIQSFLLHERLVSLLLHLPFIKQQLFHWQNPHSAAQVVAAGRLTTPQRWSSLWISGWLAGILSPSIGFQYSKSMIELWFSSQWSGFFQKYTSSVPFSSFSVPKNVP